MFKRRANLVPHSVFAKFPVFIAVTVGLIVMDFVILNSTFDFFSGDQAWLQYLTAGGIALAIDFIPIIIGELLPRYFRRQTMSRLCITFGIIAFLSALTILGLLRMSDPEVFFDNGTDNFSVFGSAPVVEKEVSSSMKTVHFFTQLLYTITPVFTSVIAFSLGVLRSQYRFLLGIQKLENRRAKLEDEYLTVQNSLIMNDFNDENNSKTEMQFKNILDEVDNLNQLMKHEVRNIYIDECDSILDRHEAGNLPVTASPEYIPQFVETNINTNPNLPPGNGADFDTYTDDNEEDVPFTKRPVTISPIFEDEE